MHPSLEELLAVRDGEAPGPIVEHLGGCGQCRDEVARLAEVKARLQALPDPEPSRDLWPAIREAAVRERARRRWVGASWAAALLVAGATGGLLLLRPAQPGPQAPKGGAVQQQAALQEPPAPAATTPHEPPATAKSPVQEPAAPMGAATGQAELASLIRRSQTLEGVLRQVNRQPRIQDGWEAAAITDLQDRVALVDGRIAQAKGQQSSKELVGLWQQRLRLLNALVKVQVDPRGTAQI